MNDEEYLTGGFAFGCAFAVLVVAMLLLGLGMGYLLWGL